MSSKNENLKTALTKIVMSTDAQSRGRKSSGTKIASNKRDISIKTIAPFSI